MVGTLPAPADVATYWLLPGGGEQLGSSAWRLSASPVAGNGAAQFAPSFPVATGPQAPQTRFGQGNNPASLPAFTSDTIRGAGAVLGATNVANAVPETKSSELAQYATKNVTAGQNAPAMGSSIGTHNGAMIAPAGNKSGATSNAVTSGLPPVSGTDWWDAPPGQLLVLPPSGSLFSDPVLGSDAGVLVAPPFGAAPAPPVDSRPTPDFHALPSVKGAA